MIEQRGDNLVEKMAKKQVEYRGIGITGVVTIVFIILKLLGVIAWSWVWVLSPFWISIGIKLLIYIILGVLVLIKLANRYSETCEANDKPGGYKQ
jgi:Flp pilus assembly protein TadB